MVLYWKYILRGNTSACSLNSSICHSLRCRSASNALVPLSALMQGRRYKSVKEGEKHKSSSSLNSSRREDSVKASAPQKRSTAKLFEAIMARKGLQESTRKQKSILGSKKKNGNTSIPPSNRPSLSPSTVEKLILDAREKQFSWLHFPSELNQLELWPEREYWINHYFSPALQQLHRSEEGDHAEGQQQRLDTTYQSERPECQDTKRKEYVTPVMVSAASTGSGKSLLTPLWMVHTHWSLMEKRLMKTLKVLAKEEENEASENVAQPSTVKKEASTPSNKVAPFPTSSLEDFTRAYNEASRICVVITQPTRLACVELSKYLCRVIAIQQLRLEYERGEHQKGAENHNGKKISDDVSRNDEMLSETRISSLVEKLLRGEEDSADPKNKGGSLSSAPTGGRIGFAVSGSSSFSPIRTEIIFSTTTYVLLTLSHFYHFQSERLLLLNQRTSNPVRSTFSSGRSLPSLRPTVLILDEAHGRQLDTDLLLTWVRVYRSHQLHQAHCGTVTREVEQEIASPSLLPSLSLVVVLSATLSLASIYRFFSFPIPSIQEHVDGRETLDHEEAIHAYRCRTLFMLSQQHHRELAAAEASSSAPKGDSGSDGSHAIAWPLWHAKWWELALRSQYQRFSFRQSILSSTSTRQQYDLSDGGAGGSSPYCVEQYFLEDLPDCFSKSALLFPLGFEKEDTSQTHYSNQKKREAEVRLPQLFSAQGRNDWLHLSHLFQVRSASRWGSGGSTALKLDPRHYRSIATVILQLLEVLQWRWGEENTMDVGGTTKHGGENKNHEEVGSAPPTLLVFVPGFSEIHQILSTLDGCSYRVDSFIENLSTNGRVGDEQGSSNEMGSGPKRENEKSGRQNPLFLAAEEIPVFRHEGSKEVFFSVVALHRATVGQPQDYLKASEQLRVKPDGINEGCYPLYAKSPPVRLLLSTSIAESSLTISNLRMVLDLCLDRTFVADATTGTTRKETTLVSASSLWQRRGRAGRTCDGMVLHLASKALLEKEEAQVQEIAVTSSLTPFNTGKGVSEENTSNTSYPGSLPELATLKRLENGDMGNEKSDSSVSSLLTAPAYTHYGFPLLPESAASIILRIAGLFPWMTGTMLASLPATLSAFSLTVGLDELIEKGLWREVEDNETNRSTENDILSRSAKDQRVVKGEMSASWKGLLSSIQHQAEMDRGIGCTTPSVTVAHITREASTSVTCHHHPLLTFKGVVISLLPLPLTAATLVFHGIQFGCIEDAVLLACCMTVPGLLVSPRIVSSRSNRAVQPGAQSKSVDVVQPLQQFIQRLSVQRRVAGQRDIPRFDPNLESADEDPSSSSHLSEPLMFRDLLRGWYLCKTPEDAWSFLSHYQIHRGVLKQIDWAIHQCCTRLLQILPHRAQQPGSKKTLLDSTGRIPHKKDGTDLPVLDVLQEQVYREFAAHVPPAYLPTLHASLSRLQHAARVRALQFSSFFYGATSSSFVTTGVYGVPQSRHQLGLPQWYMPEKRYETIFHEHYAASLPRFEGNEDRASINPVLSVSSSHSIQRAPYHPTANTIMKAPNRSMCYAFGSAEDRLCAAFIASFAMFTLQGEDSGHRHHYRRLARNVSVLEGAAEETCSFQLELQLPSSNSSASAATSSGPSDSANPILSNASLTSSSLLQALSSYFPTSLPGISTGGVGLTAAHCFHSSIPTGTTRRNPSIFRLSAIATFKRQEPPQHEREGMDPNVSLSESTKDTPSEELLLAQKPIPSLKLLQYSPYATSTVALTTQSIGQNSSLRHTVQLAPFGVSLLWATWSLLPRIPVSVSVRTEEGGNGNDNNNNNNQKGQKNDGHAMQGEASRTQTRNSSLFNVRVIRILPSESMNRDLASSSAKSPNGKKERKRKNPSKRQKKKSGAEPTDSTVKRSETLNEEDMLASWTGSSGGDNSTVFSLRRSSLIPLGLDSLFPSFAAATDQDLSQEDKNKDPPQKEQSASAPLSEASSTIAPSIKGSPSVMGTLRIAGNMHFTKAVYWKVQLPSMAAYYYRALQRYRQHLQHPPPAIGVSSKQTIESSHPAPIVPSALTDGATSKERKSGLESSNAFTSKISTSLENYCPVCFTTCSSARTFEAHCLSVSHLTHLRRCVEYGITENQLLHISSTARVQEAFMHNDRQLDSPLDSEKKETSYTPTPTHTHTTTKNTVWPTLLFPVGGALPALSDDAPRHLEEEEVSKAVSHGVEETYSPRDLLTTEVAPCFMHPHSFLNALQWTNSRCAPIAVAGALRSTPVAANRDDVLVSDIENEVLLPSQYLNPAPVLHENSISISDAGNQIEGEITTREHGGDMTVSGTSEDAKQRLFESYHATGSWCAQFTWILPVPPTSPDISSTDRGLASQKTILSPLFVIAGYLAAATRHSCTALLFDNDHKWVHGFMLLHRGGVWRFPSAIRVEDGVSQVLEAMIGGAGVWPGLVCPTESPSATSSLRNHDGLHWCSLNGACCSFDNSSCTTKRVDDELEGYDEMDQRVQSTLLIVLQEFLLSSRNVVTLPDFLERVLTKLRCGKKVLSFEKNTPVITNSLADTENEMTLLQRFLTHHYPGHSIVDLLRLIGCRFLLPSRALALTVLTPSATPSSTCATSSMDLRFTLPPILPSRLPPVDFVRRMEAEISRGRRARQGQNG